MLHIGEVEPRLRGNTREFYSLIRAILVLAFTDTVGIGIIAFVVNFLFGNASLRDLPLFLTIPPLACLLAMGVAIPLVSFLGMEAFKKGLDPDVILYPMMSTIDDVAVTVCYVVVVSLALIPGVLTGISVTILLLGIVFLAILVKHRSERVLRRTVREGSVTILLSSLLGTFGGVGLASLRGKIERHPSILILYPALIDGLGDIGSILGSIETTKLALGYVASFWNALKETFTDLASVEIAGVAIHILFGLAAFVLGRATGLNPELKLLVVIALVTNLVSFLFISLFSLIIATQTFKHGLDPDNFVIPLVTSTSDLGATLALITALTALGVV